MQGGFGRRGGQDGGVELAFAREVEFNVVRLMEDCRYGQRIDDFAVDYFDGEWKPFAKGQAVGRVFAHSNLGNWGEKNLLDPVLYHDDDGTREKIKIARADGFVRTLAAL